jgi:uncharacterized protein (TIGR03067 family)
MPVSKPKAVLAVLLASLCLIGIGTAVVPGQQPGAPDKAARVPKQAAAKEAAVKAMQERLQGTWTCVALHSDGVKSEPDLTCTFHGNTWETKLDGRTYQSGTFKLNDLDASPRQIEWVMTAPENRTMHGIFLLDGDSFICAQSDAAQDPRPQTFFTQRGDGCFAEVYRRADPKKDR